MSITQRTYEYIRTHHSVRICLEHGLINYSALAREICSALGEESFDAVLMACRRFPKSGKREKSRERTIQSLVRRAKIVLRTKMVVATIEKNNALPRALNLQQLITRSHGDIRLVEGEDTFSIITNEEYRTALSDTFGPAIRDLSSGLTLISMVFPQQITTTVGVCAYIYRLFAENGINIRDEMGCWTDVMIVISEKDATKAVALLQG